MNNNILVVDDDEKVCRLLQGYLERNGLQAVTAADGKQMRCRLKQQHIDLIVLDLMLPEEDGFTLCREVRASSQVPILMLTANSDETDRVIGLELGADDYMEKPFNPRELLARVKAILRRTEAPALIASRQGADSGHLTHFSGWQLCNDSGLLTDHLGQEISLSGSDFVLLRFFLDHPNQPLDRDLLCQACRGRELAPFDRSIDVQVSRLRQRLGDQGANHKLIQTVRNKGYMLAASVEEVGMKEPDPQAQADIEVR